MEYSDGSKVFDKTHNQNHGDITGAIFVKPYEDETNDEGDNPNVLYDDDETFWSVVNAGSGTVSVAISEETSEVKKGSSSLKIVSDITGGSYADSYIRPAYSPAVDWSKYDFLSLWWYGANTGDTISVRIEFVAWNDYYAWNFTEDFSGWKRFIFPLRRPDNQYGSDFDYSTVDAIRIHGLISSSATRYLDRTIIDVGNWKHGEALYFDGTDDEVIVTYNETLNLASVVSFSMWIKMLSYPDPSTNIVEALRSVWGVFSYRGDLASPYWEIGIQDGDGNTKAPHPTSSAIPLEEWTFVACVADGSDVIVYINGKEFARVSYNGTLRNDYTRDLSIGSYDGQRFINAYIDEVKIYKRALTSAEIRSLYEEKSFDLNRGLVLHLPFSEGSGSKVYDRSPYQNHGTVNGPVFIRPYEDETNDEGDDPLVIYDDDETFWSVEYAGAGTIALTASEETSEVKRGSSSVKLVSGAGSNQYWYLVHTYTTVQDWSKYDLISFWWYGNNSGTNIYLKIRTIADNDSNAIQAFFTDNFTGWKRIVFVLEHMDVISSSPDLSQVKKILVYSATQNTTGTWYLDRVILDVGTWKHGEALDFDGTDDYVQVSDASSLDMIDEFTLLAWIKTTAPNAENDIISKRYTEGNYEFQVLGTGFLRLILKDSDGNWQLIADDTTLVNDDEWHYVGVTFGNDGYVKIYVDGRIVKVTSVSFSLVTNSHNLIIGAREPSSIFYEGFIDEIRIYKRALALEEIRALYEKKREVM